MRIKNRTARGMTAPPTAYCMVAQLRITVACRGGRMPPKCPPTACGCSISEPPRQGTLRASEASPRSPALRRPHPDRVPVSANLPPNRNVPDAYDLDALVVGQFLSDGRFGKKSLTAHRAHGRHREFLWDLQDVYCVAAIARPKVGRHVERADEDERGKHVLKLR
jgi:hypothetical protein